MGLGRKKYLMTLLAEYKLAEGRYPLGYSLKLFINMLLYFKIHSPIHLKLDMVIEFALAREIYAKVTYIFWAEVFLEPECNLLCLLSFFIFFPSTINFGSVLEAANPFTWIAKKVA